MITSLLRLLLRLAAVLPLACLALAAPAGDRNAARKFEDANRLYEQAKYAEAAAAYESLLGQGQTSSALHFNLGNSYFKAAQLGRAIYHYRLAQALAPRDPDIVANLRFARESVQGTQLTLQPLNRAIQSISLNEWTTATTVAFWLWLILLIVRQLRPSTAKPLRAPARIAALLTILVGLGLAYRLSVDRDAPNAIVIKPDTSVRYGPLEESQAAFVLRDGAELKILDRRPGWLQVGDANSRSGWIREADVLTLH